MWLDNFQLNIEISCKFVPLCSSCYIRTEWRNRFEKNEIRRFFSAFNM